MQNKKELVKLLIQFLNDLDAFNEDVVATWSIDGLSEQVDDLISELEQEISDEEEEDN